MSASSVLIFADSDDIGMARVAKVISESAPVTWWKFLVDDELVEVDLDDDHWWIRQPGVEIDPPAFQLASVVVFRRLLHHYRPIVKSTLVEESAAKFSEREWHSVITALLLEQESFSGPRRWLNRPSIEVATGNKLSMLRRARRTGFNVPKSRIATSIYAPTTNVTNGSFVAKSISVDEQVGEATYFSTSLIEEHLLAELSGRKTRTPNLLQEYIWKKIEVRVYYVCGVLISLRLDAGAAVDIRFLAREAMNPRLTTLDQATGNLIRQFCKENSLGFCCFDLVVDKRGEFWLVDITPNGSWDYFETDLNPFVSQRIAEAVLMQVA